MSRSIHKTVAQLVRENTKRELDDPDNPDIAQLAKKIRYKKTARNKRQVGKRRSRRGSPRA